MTSQKDIDDFLDCKNIAVVGVSRKKGKFGNTVYNELKKKGYNTFAVNPLMENFGKDRCYKNLKELDGKIEAVISVVPGKQTEQIVKEADEIKINNIWMQQGSESVEAIDYCHEHGIKEIHKECILMFAEPVKSIHSFHKWIWKILGKLPN